MIDLPPGHANPPAVVVHHQVDADAVTSDIDAPIRAIRGQFAVSFTPGTVADSAAMAGPGVIPPPPEHMF